jgi:hypothetical protein
MPAEDGELNVEVTDIFHSTPHRESFPSPLDTMVNTLSKSIEKTSVESRDGLLNGDIDVDDIPT